MFPTFSKGSAVLISACWLIGTEGLLAAGAAGGEPVYSFTRYGKPATFVLATDELVDVSTSGSEKIRHLSSNASPESVLEAARQSRTGAVSHLVFYPEGKEGDPMERLVLRGRLQVKLQPDANPEQVRVKAGAVSITPVAGSTEYYILTFSSATALLESLASVESNPWVVSAEPLFARKISKDAVPTDPLFAPAAGRGYYQWHLRNPGHAGGLAGIDANIEDAWDTQTGQGITIAIVDDGLEISHPDLQPNTGNSLHRNWNDGEPNNPVPTSNLDTHGTSAAGVAAARWNNGILGSGAAPMASLVGLRLTAGFVDDADIAEALLWSNDQIHIYNNSWGLDNSFDSTLKIIPPVIRSAIENGVTNGRNGRGSIYVFSAGNQAQFNDNSNYGSMVRMSETIAVGAVDDSGRRSYYSEPGANLVVSAPSDGGTLGITTTNFRGIPEMIDGQPVYPNQDFTSDFGGTSASASVVSGVVALMLQANPNLGWRDVQEILMKSARKVSPGDAEWYTNAAEFHFNHDFGAGLVDAAAAVELAASWTNLGPRVAHTKAALTGIEIPDNTGNSLVIPINFADRPNLRVEHVEVEITALHLRRADLDIVLISPNGTQSVLAANHTGSDEQSISDHVFMTVRNWGEGSAGTWLLRVTDRRNGVTGFLNDYKVTIFGTEDEEAPVNEVPVLVSNRVIRGVQNNELIHKIETLVGTTITVGTLPTGLTFNPATGFISGVPTEAGVIDTPVTLTNSKGSTDVTLSFVIEPTTAALGQGIEQDGISVVTSGDGEWAFEFTNVSPTPGAGGDAISSPLLGDNQSSEISFPLSVFEPAVVIFDWRTSSEAGSPAVPANPALGTPALPSKTGDRLYFSLVGESPEHWTSFIGGDVPWSTTGAKLQSGLNQLRWRYQKDESISALDDRGFLDYVRVLPYDVFLNQVNAAISASEAPMTEAVGTSSADVELDFPGRTLWLPVDEENASGGRAIRSSAIGDGQSVVARTTVKGPGVLSFRWRVSAATGDRLGILVNGLSYGQITGMTQWETVTIDLPVGESEIVWEYLKNASGASGSDAGFLDDISYNQQFTYDIWLSEFFNPSEITAGLSDPDADPDGDGISNFMEYAWGTNPKVANGPSPRLPVVVPGSEEGSITFRFTTDADLLDLSYVVQTSVDLNEWENVDSSELVEVETNGSLVTYELEIPAPLADPSKFYRVQVDKVANP